MIIRIVLPYHLRNLARVEGEVQIEVEGSATLGSVLDALEARYPMLRGTIRDHGALEYRECAGDDLHVKFGVPFPKQMKIKPGETVVFAWIVYKSRAHRDSVNAKVMKDPRLAKMMDSKSMPFDCKRMVYGGFKVLVDA